MLVSVAVAARNASRFIAEALESVPGSLGGGGACCDHEILLADGASDDGTVAIAATYPRVRIISRSDTGLYDGMNRAIAAARGDFLVILNSDDVLEPGGIGAAIEELVRKPEVGLCSGAVRFGARRETAALLRHRNPLSTTGTIFGISAINARVYRRELIQRAGPLRTDVGLGADREWLLRVLRAGGPGAAIDAPIYFYRQHAGSMTLANDRHAALRIYESDVRLASALWTASGAPDRGLARALYALADLKLRLRTTTRARDTQVPPEGMRVSPLDTTRGLVLWARWRSHLSGA